MACQKYFLLIFIGFFSLGVQAQKFGFNKVLKESPDLKMPFTVDNNSQNLAFLRKEGVNIKHITEHYIYITQSPEWIFRQINDKKITNFYFEYAPPTLLDDTSRAMHHVNEVHSGTSPLFEKYTGKGVIIGLVDNGLDHNHPDFIDSLGRKRVIRYWDQSITNPTTSPQPYGYGQIWYEQQIQNNLITSNEESSGHGTSVTGICAGNGLANGKNKGMAPEADIIFVETNFNLPNWTLTVADACDFIFRVADSLKKPAVINLSVGSSLGSHDGTDPAGALMTQLVEEKPGRIIVGAAGNNGNHVPYHAQQFLLPTDTNFIWFKNNPNGTLGPNTVFFDLWSNINDAQFYYSLGANRPGADYADVAATSYRFAQLNVGTPIFDTLFNAQGNRIATIEIYTEYQAGNFHLQGFFSQVDSTDYLFRFSTTGNGKYDLWTSEQMGLNKIVHNIPTAQEYPPIVNYVLPDSLQSIVSSWNCAPKILSVGNIRNRLGYLDVNGEMYYPASMTTPGRLATNSSKGPTRAGHLKPDISATGQLTLGSAPMYMVNNPQTHSGSLADGGYHMRNGGTSMASPVVAGIAALYLERCPKSTVEDFKNDLFSTAFGDNFTGNLPNIQYGHGKIHAFDLLKSRNSHLKILGDTAICQMPVTLTTNIPLDNYFWSNGSLGPEIVVSQPDTIFLYGHDEQGCSVYSDTIVIYQGSPLPNPIISLENGVLVANENQNYQWYFNDNPIPGATQQSHTPTEPGYYSVAVQGADNCKSFSNAFYWTVGLENNEMEAVFVYPNPTKDYLIIETKNNPLEFIEITSITGQILYREKIHTEKHTLDIRHFSGGAYLLKMQTKQGGKIFSVFKE